MRVWSIHPKYLDAKGLVATWRETLLAQNVLAGNTKGYTNHPQLDRFRQTLDPIQSISNYLHLIHEESERRSYSFDRSKIARDPVPQTMSVTQGQVEYEFIHLLKKLKIRSPELYLKYQGVNDPDPHPLFQIEPGDIEPWEIT